MIFDSIDGDNNGTLCRNEFKLYIEGTKMTIEERRKNLPEAIVRDIKT